MLATLSALLHGYKGSWDRPKATLDKSYHKSQGGLMASFTNIIDV